VPANDRTTQPGRPVRRPPGGERRRALVIALALFICYGYFYYLGGNWNVESRNAQIVALAEDHTLAIDRFHYWTGDEAYYRGHYYSDKMVGPSLVAVPVYWVSIRLAPPRASQPLFPVMLSLRVANLLTNALPTALLGAFLYLFLAELGLGAGLRAWLAIAYGFGTLALPYSTALFGHQFGAVCAFASFALLWRQREGWSTKRAVVAGALAGLGAISDFTTLLISCFLALYALWAATGRGTQQPAVVERACLRPPDLLVRVLPFAAALLLAASPQLIANWSSFGSPLAFPHVHHVQPSFQARHTAGLLGVHLPQLFPLYQLTFGSWRGLFHGSPALLLALPGFFLLGRRWRPEAILIAAAWVGVVLMSAGYENWTAGSVYGPRYQIAAIPLLLLPVAASAQRLPVLFKLLAAISIALMLAVTAQSPFVAETLRTPLASALGLFVKGQLLHGNLGKVMGLQGLLSLAPLVLVEAGLLYLLTRQRAADRAS
jgi:hypothetical protein